MSGANYFKEAHKELKETLKAIDYVTPNAKMIPQMSNLGEYIQTFMIYKLDKDDDGKQNYVDKNSKSKNANANALPAYIYSIQRKVEMDSNFELFLPSQSFKNDGIDSDESDIMYIVRCDQW